MSNEEFCLETKASSEIGANINSGILDTNTTQMNSDAGEQRGKNTSNSNYKFKITENYHASIFHTSISLYFSAVELVV